MSVKISTRGIKRLEMTMRDVMDGLEDAASYINYHSTPNIIEILSIECPGRPVSIKQNIVPINCHLTENDHSDIVEYLIQQELKRTA